jgi:hypothetical protein
MNDFVGNVQHAVAHAVAVIASGAVVEKVCQSRSRRSGWTASVLLAPGALQQLRELTLGHAGGQPTAAGGAGTLNACFHFQTGDRAVFMPFVF